MQSLLVVAFLLMLLNLSGQPAIKSHLMGFAAEKSRMNKSVETVKL
jgi:hypothetical protein